MRIKSIVSQSRRDFTAIYECEHCGNLTEMGGYDDANFHQNVIPTFACIECGEKGGGENYRPLTTKYPEGHQI